MRRGHPADRAQRDDEQVRHSRIDAESIATAIPVVIDRKAASSAARPARGLRRSSPSELVDETARSAGPLAQTRLCKAVLHLGRHADQPKNRWNFNLKLGFPD
jgi:hypothetical protein